MNPNEDPQTESHVLVFTGDVGLSLSIERTPAVTIVRVTMRGEPMPLKEMKLSGKWYRQSCQM